jgi:hypothetical protein
LQDAALRVIKALGALNAMWTPWPAQLAVLYAIFTRLFPVVFLECGRKWGKTEIESYFLWRKAITRPGGYYYFAPEQKQAKEIVWASGRIQTFGPQDQIASINNTEMRITLKNGAFIKIDGSDNFNAYRGITPHGAVYDEFRDFRPEFHKAMGPNLGVHEAQLFIGTTPPEELKVEQYDAMLLDLVLGENYFNFPTWACPNLTREWLRTEKSKLYLRGEWDTWEREYGAKRVIGGANAIFPMFDSPTKEKKHTKHVRPHDELMREVRDDAHKMLWQVICDPGTATCFAVVFRAINPYTKKVYVLGEIYEQNQLDTSTSVLLPRICEMRDRLFPGWKVHGTEWEQICDEAAAWFIAEAWTCFNRKTGKAYEESFTPTRKGTKDKKTGLSLIKDQMLAGLFVVSDECPNLIGEISDYRRDDNGNIPKKNDHAIDCLRYGNDYASIDLTPEPEKILAKTDRYSTPERDLARYREESGEVDIDFCD